jgi:hypothetical protein
VLDHCWVSDHLIQLKVPAAAVLNPHLKTTIRHEAVLTGFPSLEQLTAGSLLIKINRW